MLKERGQLLLILAIIVFLYVLAMMFIGGWHCALTWEEMFKWWHNYCSLPIVPLGTPHP